LYSNESVLYRTLSYRTLSYRTLSYRTVPYRTVPNRTVPQQTDYRTKKNAPLKTEFGVNRSVPKIQFFPFFNTEKLYEREP
jgi:hypothetical protein